MLEGFWKGSASVRTGTSTGKPPAAQTPRRTASARSRKWPWQQARSLHVLTIAMTGRPENSSSA